MNRENTLSEFNTPKTSELRSMLNAYQLAVNQAAIVSIADLQGRIIYANDKFTEASGYSLEEVVGHTHRIINSGYHDHKFFSDLWLNISAGNIWRGQIRNKTKQGNYYWEDIVITPVKDNDGHIIQYLSISNNISSLKEKEEALLKADQELRQKKQQLKDAQQIAKMGSWYMDIPNQILTWSEETYRIFEIDPYTTVSNDFFISFVPHNYKEEVRAAWADAQKTGTYFIEHPIQTASGIKWVCERAHFEVDNNGIIKTAIGTVQDITEKRAAEDQIKRSEKLYRQVFENSANAVGIMDKETMRFLEVNETAVKMYGYSKEEFRQLTAYDIRVTEEHTALNEQRINDDYAGNTVVRKHRKKNGECILIEPYITEILYDDKPVFLITIHDVTETVKIEQELSNARELHRRETARARLEAQEKSRSEMGRELHDNINQMLVAATLFLKRAQIVPEETSELMKTGIGIIDDTMEEIRKLSSSFVPPSLKVVSLEEAIKHLGKKFTLTNIQVEYDFDFNESNLTDAHKINLYRIVQEQFSNIIKYAEASRVMVTLRKANGSLLLEVKDNGKGFDPAKKAGGIGLSNIVYRAEAYNGTAIIDSTPGRGCRISIQFPL